MCVVLMKNGSWTDLTNISSICPAFVLTATRVCIGLTKFGQILDKDIMKPNSGQKLDKIRHAFVLDMS